MTTGNFGKSFPERKDGRENTNPYCFIEDVVQGYLKPAFEQTVDDKVDTYRELTASFLAVSKHVSELLGYFKTIDSFDPVSSFYAERIIDLEIIFSTAHALMSRFHSLAMLSLTGSKENIDVSSGFWMSVLTTIGTLRCHVQELLGIKQDIDACGTMTKPGECNRIYHPSSISIDREGFAVFH